MSRRKNKKRGNGYWRRQLCDSGPHDFQQYILSAYFGVYNMQLYLVSYSSLLWKVWNRQQEAFCGSITLRKHTNRFRFRLWLRPDPADATPDSPVDHILHPIEAFSVLASWFVPLVPNSDDATDRGNRMRRRRRRRRKKRKNLRRERITRRHISKRRVQRQQRQQQRNEEYQTRR